MEHSESLAWVSLGVRCSSNVTAAFNRRRDMSLCLCLVITVKNSALVERVERRTLPCDKTMAGCCCTSTAVATSGVATSVYAVMFAAAASKIEETTESTERIEML